MPYILTDLVIDRVDLVDEGANSAAFIELYKRKEKHEMSFEEILSKMKPEHSSVIQAAFNAASEELKKAKEDLATVTKERNEATQELAKAKEDLVTANDDLAKTKEELDTLKAKEKETCECDGEADEEGRCKACGKPKKAANFDETETMKSMPESIRKAYEKMKSQKDAAEAELRKAREAERTAEAVAKANELKSIPVEKDKLVGIIKNASPELLDLLTVVNAAIDGTVLGEVGKNHTGGNGADAWTKIEAKADEIAKRDNITKSKAIAKAIKENPELYKEYLQGGAN